MDLVNNLQNTTCILTQDKETEKLIKEDINKIKTKLTVKKKKKTFKLFL